jgi:predicted RNA binding protein YcfA (HicA-like mRNA interferase family)
MVTIKVKDILNGLARKGFCQSEGDHSHLILYVNGKKTSIRTKVSHGSSEIGDNLINIMSIQLKLEKKKFIDLINCPLTMKDYLEELKGCGITFT